MRRPPTTNQSGQSSPPARQPSSSLSCGWAYLSHPPRKHHPPRTQKRLPRGVLLKRAVRRRRGRIRCFQPKLGGGGKNSVQRLTARPTRILCNAMECVVHGTNYTITCQSTASWQRNCSKRSTADVTDNVHRLQVIRLVLRQHGPDPRGHHKPLQPFRRSMLMLAPERLKRHSDETSSCRAHFAFSGVSYRFHSLRKKILCEMSRISPSFSSAYLSNACGGDGSGACL